MTTQAHSPVRDFVDALGRLDFAALADSFASDVRFRALVPPGFRECTGSAAAAQMIAGWFEDTDDPHIAAFDAGTIGDREYAGYRIRVRADGSYQVAEQRLVCTTSGGKIATMDFLCSGFHEDLASA